MHTTRHDADHLRFLSTGPAGLLEARITPTFAAVIHHLAECDGEHCANLDCDAEIGQGNAVATAWQLDGDEAVWTELNAIHTRHEIAAIANVPHEPTAEQRDLAARLWAEGERVAAEGSFIEHEEDQ
jgi:hypothetical protein